MTYRTTVQHGVVKLPPDAMIADGTEVEVTVRPKGSNLGDLLGLAGSWRGEDAEAVVDLIYGSRSSRELPNLH